MFLTIRDKLMNLPMRIKLTILCFTLLAVSTFLSISVVYLYTSSVIKSDAEKYTNEVMVQSQKYLDEKLSAILSKTNYLHLNTNFIKIMKNILHGENVNYVSESSKITDILYQIKAGNELIESVYVHTQETAFYTLPSGRRTKIFFTDTELFHEIDNIHKIYWGTTSYNELFTNETLVIPIVIPVTIYNENMRDAYIIVNLNAKVLQKELYNISENIDGMVYIRNARGDLVVSDSFEESRVWQIEEILNGNQEDAKYYQMSEASLSINEWVIGCIQSEQVLLKKVYILRYMMVLIAGICILLFTGVAVILADSITRPLKKLQEMMKNVVAFGFEQKFNVKYKDEVGQLANGFNDMCIRISDLMKQVEREEEQKRTAEFRALSAQMNPHFLYNTLDCIYWACMKNGNMDVANVALNISNVFRLGLNKGNEITTVEKEIKHVTSYLEIQKTIYRGKFEFQIFCEQELLSCETIKLLLQPLVENSIVHGFQRIESGGTIFVEILSQREKILFRVTDNGEGMEASAIRKILEEKGEDSFAVYNIIQRLNLHYGEEAGLTYYNKEECGFAAEIVIPRRK